MKIFGCGDIFISKRLPKNGYNGFEELRELISSHDVAFGNLETTVHNNEGYPARFPGGGYAMASPKCIEDVKAFGINVVNIANNHALDYSHKGLEATIEHLTNADLQFFGAGFNLADASRPKYVECREGRVAFIGVTSSFHDSDSAGPAGGIIPGRPGVNPLRRTEVYQLTPDLFEQVVRIADATGMNDGHKWSIANGYREATKGQFLREMQFVEGTESKRITHPLKEDMERIKTSIREAKIQADCVVVSFHSHQMKGSAEYPADFIVEFCHECIDTGADIIFGHGAHEIRGLEMYNNRPIFYGLGDFIFHNEMQEAMPKEFYEKVGLDVSLHDNVGIAMNERSKNQTRGLQADKKAWNTIATSIDFENEEIKQIKIYPVSLGYELGHSQRGWPKIDYCDDILERFKKISFGRYSELIVFDRNHIII